MRIKLKKIVMPVIPLLMIGLIVSISSCCEDCIINPTSKPYRGWLYAKDDGKTIGVVYKIDTETDSVVDSIQHEGPEIWAPGIMGVSQQGRFLAILYISLTPGVLKTRIFDAQTLNLITELDVGITPIFVESSNLLIGLMNNGIRIYSLPDFGLIKEDLIGSTSRAVLFEEDNLIYIRGLLRPESSDSFFLFVYNYIDMEIEDTIIVSDSMGNWFKLQKFDINNEHDRLYFLGFSAAVPSSLNCYDLVNRKFLYREPVYSVNGDLKLTPSGDEFYVVDPGYPPYNYFSPGTVFIYNAKTCNYVNGISLYGYTHDENYDLPLYAHNIAFTPDGNKAYIGTGDISRADGGIAVINTRTKQITKIIWPELEHYIGNIQIGPKY